MIKLQIIFYVFYVILFIFDKTTNGLTLSPCGEDQVFEVLENTPRNTCLCKADGLSGVVEWSLIINLRRFLIGTCSLTTLTCTPPQIPGFTLQAESGYVTKVNINTTDISYILQNASIICKLSAKLEEKCKIDHVVEVKDVRCLASYDSAITPWRVVVTCTVGFAYSFLNRYSCQLYQVDKGAVKIGQMAAMIISQIEKHYVSGFCRMSAPISNEGRHFSYNVIISPGRKIFSAMFIGQNSTIHPSVILQFGFNNNRRDMTVNEMEVVVLTCYADGKPSPQLQIKKMSNGIVLASAPQGMMSIDDETTEVRHTFNMTRCDDTGRYVCEVDSMVEEDKHAFAELYVKCAPRLLYSSEMSEMTKHVIFTDSRSALSFVVAAYPLPSTPTVMFWKEISDNFSSEAMDAVQLKCQPFSELYQTNCTITVNRELCVETGNYSVIFVNDLGRVEYRFEIRLNGNNPDILQSYPPIGAYVGGAFGAGIFLLAISVGVIVLLKHRRKQRTSEDGANNITTNALQVDNASQADVPNEGAYSSMQMADVGQRSPYDDFHIYSN